LVAPHLAPLALVGDRGKVRPSCAAGSSSAVVELVKRAPRARRAPFGAVRRISGGHRVHTPSPVFQTVENNQTGVDGRRFPEDARAVSVETLGQLIREGGAVALALVVYSELRLMRQTLGTLAERMSGR
jgi:hypothetical protein